VTFGELAARLYPEPRTAAPPPLLERSLDMLMDQRIYWQETGTGPQHSLRLPALSAVVRLIASSIDQLELTRTSGKRLPAWLAEPRRYGGSPLDLGDLLMYITTAQLMRGAAYLEVERVGESWVLYPLHWQSVTATVSSGGRLAVTYKVDGKDMRVITPAVTRPQGSYLLPVPYLVTPERPYGTTPVIENWEALLGYQKIEDSSANVADAWHNGGILHSEQDLTPETARRYKQAFHERRPGEVLVMGSGLQFDNIAPSARDSLLDQARLYNSQIVASLFGVPPSQLGMTHAGSGSSMSYSNIQQDRALFASTCLRAITTQQEDALSVLLPEGDRLRFDYTTWEEAGNAASPDRPIGPDNPGQ